MADDSAVCDDFTQTQLQVHFSLRNTQEQQFARAFKCKRSEICKVFTNASASGQHHKDGRYIQYV